MAEPLKLYRCPNPTNYLCPCGDVRRRLDKLDYEIEEIRVPRKRAEREAVRELTGQDRVPLVIFEDGEKVWDSRRIREHLKFRLG